MFLGCLSKSNPTSIMFSSIPSGKRLHNYGKSPCYSWENPLFLWSFSIAMLIFFKCYLCQQSAACAIISITARSCGTGGCDAARLDSCQPSRARGGVSLRDTLIFCGRRHEDLDPTWHSLDPLDPIATCKSTCCFLYPMKIWGCCTAAPSPLLPFPHGNPSSVPAMATATIAQQLQWWWPIGKVALLREDPTSELLQGLPPWQSP